MGKFKSNFHASHVFLKNSRVFSPDLMYRKYGIFIFFFFVGYKINIESGFFFLFFSFYRKISMKAL